MTYDSKLERAGSPRRPYVEHETIDGVDLCVDVKLELEIRTRMSGHGPHGRTNGVTPAQVSLHPRIEFEPCGVYFSTDRWLGGRKGLRARQEVLHRLHEKIVRAFGGAKKLESWKNLKDAPANVTVLGAAPEDVRAYMNKKLAELPKVPGSHGHPGPDGLHDHGGGDHGASAGGARRAKRSKVLTMKPAKRRGAPTRRAKRPRQTSKSKTPSRAR